MAGSFFILEEITYERRKHDSIYAKANSREYFADCFVYWITYSGNEKRMEAFRNATPETYAYMEKLATNKWVC